MNKPTVLLDIDHTILDFLAIKKVESEMMEANYGPGSADIFWEVYRQVQKEKGHFGVKEVAMRFAEAVRSNNYASAVAAFMEVDFKKFLYRGAKELIDFLSKNSNLIIFTHGDEIFQGQKVKKLGLDRVSKKVVITLSKAEAIGKTVEESGAGPYFMIDDNAEVIIAAQKQKKPITTILVTIDPHHSEGIKVQPDFVADDLTKVLDFLKKKFQTV